MKIEYVDPATLAASPDMVNAQAKVTTCGNVTEVMYMSRVNRQGPSIIRLGGTQYCYKDDIDKSTGELIGEVKEFETTENRGQNLYGLSKSMKTVRDLINCNVVTPANVRWMTFTYAENMTDTKRLYSDRGAFWKRVKRWHIKQGYSEPEYIAIVEPQGRGAWHLHELWIYPNKAPFLPNDTIAQLWQQGFVTVKKLDDVDNVGAYVTAYLCDVPLEDCSSLGIDATRCEIKEAEITLDDGTKTTKKYVKGARLHLYPNKMNFYRTSRNIKRPSVEWTNGQDAKKKVSGSTLTYSKGIQLTDDESNFTSKIMYEHYNTVRRQCQDNIHKK